MKLSDLIKKLKEVFSEEGDLPVSVYNEEADLAPVSTIFVESGEVVIDSTQVRAESDEGADTEEDTEEDLEEDPKSA